MPTTLTLNDIPDDIYERLKQSAASHRRSLNSEILACLESVLMPERVSPTERLARARILRSATTRSRFRARVVDTMKREGRS
jgi:antitoxin FitA